MQVDPKKSRQAHSQIGSRNPAAASSSPHPDSLNIGCDQRGPHLAEGRSASARQPLIRWATPDDYLEGPARHLTIPPGPPSKLPRILLIGVLAALCWLGLLWVLGAL